MNRIAKQEMKSSLPTVILAAGLMTVAIVSAYAESSGSSSKRSDSDKFQWRQVTDDVSVSEYRETYRHNKRVLRSTVRSYSEGAAESLGLPKRASQLAGGAAGVAASLLTNHDLKFRLNDKKTFAFEVRDPVDNDRALFLNYQLKW
ncbi:MAG: hypothetical protein BMS9Abin08_0587 [Gammaproteobacteria bacterium]|nr:MAG: hypothetical protein BMS9Abin08_0587 [Gammaproteobacteria bacterium]